MAVTPLRLQPAKQPGQLGAHHEPVGQSGEEQLDGVQDDALGADRVDRVTQPDEQPLEIVFAGLRQLGALEAHVIEQQPPPGAQALQVEAERPGVLHEVVGGLLERHEDAGLVVLERAAHQEFHGEQRLAAARAAAHQGGPAARQSAIGDFVQTRDAGRGLGQRAVGRSPARFVGTGLRRRTDAVMGLLDRSTLPERLVRRKAWSDEVKSPPRRRACQESAIVMTKEPRNGCPLRGVFGQLLRRSEDRCAARSTARRSCPVRREAPRRGGSVTRECGDRSARGTRPGRRSRRRRTPGCCRD